MNSLTNQQLDYPKKMSDLAYQPIRNVSKLSPYHQRVTVEKRYLQKKQKLRSILIMGHLQKMQLNAINNRSIETMRKTKVAQEMSKKRYQSVDSNRETRDQLKIDNRSKRRQKIKTQIAQNIIKHSQKSSQIQQAYEKLIDDYLKHVSQDKLLEKGMDRKKIIEQACQIIRAQMAQKTGDISKPTVKPFIMHQRQQPATMSQKRTLTSSQQNLQLPSIRQFPLLNKNSPHKSDRLLQISSRRHAKSLQRHKQPQTSMMRAKPSPSNRSVIQIECNQSLRQLQNEQNFMSKQRMREEKLFLRKMKLIGMKNAATLRSFLKEQ